jgi:hypothetical protein
LRPCGKTICEDYYAGVPAKPKTQRCEIEKVHATFSRFI